MKELLYMDYDGWECMVIFEHCDWICNMRGRHWKICVGVRIPGSEK